MPAMSRRRKKEAGVETTAVNGKSQREASCMQSKSIVGIAIASK